MGKNKKKNTKKVEEHKKESNSSELVLQNDQYEEVKQPATAEEQKPLLTPQERAEDYRKTQMENYEQFIADFKDDANALLELADFSEKEKELEKVKKQELIKCEKQIKKDINEWEEIFAGNASLAKSSKGLQTLGEKILKIMDSSIKKQLRKGLQSEEYRLLTEQNLDSANKSLTNNMKVKKTLEMLCHAIFVKNYNLFLKHEMMLDN
jgi:hypothetical protein